MEIKERIEAIKPYFKTCLMAEDKFLVIVHFGDKWVVPNPKSVMEKYGVNFALNKENGECQFGTSMNGDYNVIFDVIESIIKRNKDLEERKNLLVKYHKELDAIFVDKAVTLEMFRNLKFNMNDTANESNMNYDGVITEGKVHLNVEDENEETSEVLPIVEDSENIVSENNEVEETVAPIPQPTTTPKRGRPAKNGGSSLLSKAVNLTKK